MGEAGAKVVVHIFGDAGAFAFDGVLLFEKLHAALEFADFNVTNAAGDCAADHEDAGGEKPPGLVEGRNDADGEDAADFVPDAVVVCGDDVEAIVAGREVGIVGGAARAGVLPIFVEIFEAITEADFFGSAET